ncbi:hypothetical protein [Nonomuraea fuscirosea]|uniref:hypothetical protein n=1 Tax=Nonomuraea fuscirosea TaxID=1291556 RepID=UPI0034336B31
MDENFLYDFKGSPPTAACHASGDRWPRCGSSAGRGQRRQPLCVSLKVNYGLDLGQAHLPAVQSKPAPRTW